VIDGIAFQTNILALNAAVEAAAQASKAEALPWWPARCAALAGRSAEAAKEIKRTDPAPAWSVWSKATCPGREGRRNHDRSGFNAIRRVTDIMGEISAASSEQSAGVSQVGEAVTQMDQATQQNAALVEQMCSGGGQPAAARRAQLVQRCGRIQAVFRRKLPAPQRRTLRCSACHGLPPENLRSIRHGEALAHMARRLQLIHDGHGQVGHADGAGLLAGHQG
jgi:methyl-accepting chemotaxis protein